MKKKVFIPALVILVLAVALLVFLNQEAPPDPINSKAMESDGLVTVTVSKHEIIFTPTGASPDTAFVYYQGANVAPESFAYAGRRIAEAGFKVILVKMPFSLAILDIGAAYPYPEKYPDIKHWSLGGFSLGGASAAFALANKESRYEALVLYASYTDEKHSLWEKDLKVLSISGTNDGLATPQKIEKGKPFLPLTTEYLVIDGGNHTQFALYGNGKLQRNDNRASIGEMEQQQVVIDETIAFLR